jgi:hypothetical protein
MSFTRDHKETLHVVGTCDGWSGKCLDALQRAGFDIHENSATAYRVKAVYKGFTIDGTIQLTFASVGVGDDGEKIDITMRISADTANPFALFADPCKRIRDAFLAELWRKRRRRQD